MVTSNFESSITYYLAIPAYCNQRHGQIFGCARELLGSARALLRAWTGVEPIVLLVDGVTLRSWEGENKTCVRFEPSVSQGEDIHVILNFGFLLLDNPPLERLLQAAKTSGAAWCGNRPCQDSHAFAFVGGKPDLFTLSGQAIFEGHESLGQASTLSINRQVNLHHFRSAILGAFSALRRWLISGKGLYYHGSPLWLALKHLTAVRDEDVDNIWRDIEKTTLIPTGRSAESSPALAGISDTWHKRWFDSPRYWNTALNELLAVSDQNAPINGSPAKMAEALSTHLRDSRVPFVFNSLLNGIEHRMGTKMPQSFPPEIHLSLTGRCNIECRFCGYTHEVGRREFVTAERVQEMDLLVNVQTLRLNSGLGEPTLNKDISTIITQMTTRFPHLAINFFTNAVALHRPGLIESLIGNVRWVNVSLNAATRRQWEEQCKLDQFDSVCRNVRRLHELKRQSRSLWPLVFASMVLNRANMCELPLMPALCRELGIDRLTAFPYFALGLGQEKFGADMALAGFREEYDALYAETVENARIHQVSLELPLPTERMQASFGLEVRTLYDFAGIEVNEWPTGRFLSTLAFEQPEGAYCHFLWRQGAIGSTNNAGHARAETHYIYPCIGPLSSVDLSRKTAYRFAETDFLDLWRNPIFERLRSAQHERGVCSVCDYCRGHDTRNPEGFSDLQTLVAQFAEQYAGIPATPIERAKSKGGLG